MESNHLSSCNELTKRLLLNYLFFIYLGDFAFSYKKFLIAESPKAEVGNRTRTFFGKKNIIEIAVRIFNKITDLLMLPLHHFGIAR